MRGRAARPFYSAAPHAPAFHKEVRPTPRSVGRRDADALDDASEAHRAAQRRARQAQILARDDAVLDAYLVARERAARGRRAAAVADDDAVGADAAAAVADDDA